MRSTNPFPKVELRHYQALSADETIALGSDDLRKNAGVFGGNIMDTIEALTATPLLPLPNRWHIPRQAVLLEQARATERTGGPDAYWESAARHLRSPHPREGPHQTALPKTRHHV